jgi:protein involved in polysaccharide export with SLBB domain
MVIYVIGQVNAPGPYPLAPDMTVLQALSTAGGYAEWADTKNIMIVRRQDGKDTQLRFNHKKFISGKNLKQNILLKWKEYKVSINSGCIKKIPLNPPLQKTEADGTPGLIEM